MVSREVSFLQTEIQMTGDCYVLKHARRSVRGKTFECFEREISVFKLFQCNVDGALDLNYT